MRSKRTRPAAQEKGKRPTGQAGLTIDWIGVQETGSGGASVIPAWLVAGLAALRAAPALVGAVSRRLATRHGRAPRR